MSRSVEDRADAGDVPFDYAPFYRRLREEAGLSEWAERLPEIVAEEDRLRPHGKLAEWLAALKALPGPDPDADVDLRDAVRVEGGAMPGIEPALLALRPWRKGPFFLHGLHVDAEWRSDWKWERVRPHIESLSDRRVLDIGCGNGYHCWRMAGAGARLAIGIDPTRLSVAQFFAVRHFVRDPRVWVLPLGIERLPPAPGAFDTVFSMGLLYHRKDPGEHLERIRRLLRPGGEAIVETLVVVDGSEDVLRPAGRYAKMRNVYAIPSPERLEAWMRRAGFEDVRVVDVTPTTPEEQRSTGWMTYESLADFLDPLDPRRSVEGHPAPVRAVAVARAPAS